MIKFETLIYLVLIVFIIFLAFNVNSLSKKNDKLQEQLSLYNITISNIKGWDIIEIIYNKTIYQTAINYNKSIYTIKYEDDVNTSFLLGFDFLNNKCRMERFNFNCGEEDCVDIFVIKGNVTKTR